MQFVFKMLKLQKKQLQVIMKKKEQDGLNMIPKIKFWHYTGVEETTKFTMHPEKL